MRLPVIVVACKTDLRPQLASEQASAAIEQYDTGLVEVSAMTESGKDQIRLAFDWLVRSILRKRRREFRFIQVIRSYSKIALTSSLDGAIGRLPQSGITGRYLLIPAVGASAVGSNNADPCHARQHSPSEYLRCGRSNSATAAANVQPCADCPSASYIATAHARACSLYGRSAR
jgi:hypothetical protein